MTPGTSSAGRRRLPHLPALDGLRGLALLGVLGFHAEISWMRGGYLPLTAFFVLSGFLVTSLLLLERQETGRVRAAAFWARRARRLVPAALLGVTVAAAYVRATGGDLPRFRWDAFSSLAWLANWRFAGSDQSYAELFSDPSPLQHFWSLAIEEQFYVALPLLVLLVTAVTGRGRKWPLGVVAAALALGSTAAMAALHDPAVGPLRAYYGTDTRAAELLVGVVLATVLIGPSGLRRLHPRARRAADIAGLAAVAATVALWVSVRQYDDWLFRGGLLGLAVLAALAVVAGSQPGTVTSRLLGVRPLASLGRVSYGAYILHWPLFLWLSPDRTGLEGAPLLALRLGVVLPAAYLSYRLLERPVRYGSMPARTAPLAWANGTVAVVAAVVIATTAVTAAPTVTLRAEGEAPPPPPPAPVTASGPGEQAAAPPASGAPQPASPGSAGPQPDGSSATTGGNRTEEPTTSPTSTTPAPAAQPPAPAPVEPDQPPPLRVMVVGDSLAQNIATGLIRWGERTDAAVVWDHGLAGCPLSRGGERRTDMGDYPIHPKCGWWGEPEARDAIDSFVPDVMLVVAGFNDLFDRKLDTWPVWRRPGDPIFDSWVLSEYQAAVDVFSFGDVPVVWAPPPCLNWDSWRQHIAPEEGERRRSHHNDVIFRGLLASTDVTHADIDAQLCPDGEYDPDALGMENSRPDGLHLTDEASEELAERWLGPLLQETVAR